MLSLSDGFDSVAVIGWIPQHRFYLFTSRWAITYTLDVILSVDALLSGHPTCTYDPFPQPALDDEYQSEKVFNDCKYRLYQLCNQNFHSRLEVSKSEDQVKKLEAEAISQHNEYPTLSAWLQERADQEDIGQEHEQTQDHLDNI